MKYHKNARFNYEQRKEIARRVGSGESVTKIATEFNTTRKTIYKWARSDDYYDRSSRPKKFGPVTSHHLIDSDFEA